MSRVESCTHYITMIGVRQLPLLLKVRPYDFDAVFMGQFLWVPAQHMCGTWD